MLLFLNMGGSEWIFIILAILILFGGRKIPELMKGVGSGIREFNKAKNDVTDHLRDGMNEKPKSEKEEDKKAE